MKKSMLACALLLTYTASYADDTSLSPTAPSPQTAPTGGTAPATTAAPTTSPAAATTTTPATTQPGAAPTTGATNLTPPTQPTTQTISCNFHFPANITIPQSVVQMWAEKAVVQTFDYNSENVDLKLQTLKACFTDPGWIGFTSALDQSGNLSSIRAQKLTVSAQMDGLAATNPLKENQWRVTLPLEVVYQNKQDKVTQLLSIDLIVARKVSGDLGIQQIIASPRKENAPK